MAGVVTATGIARMAGVGRAAVSNWRRRYADFPEPVGGSASSPAFDLAAVEEWLVGQGKLAEASAMERAWRRVEAFSTASAMLDALCLAGVVLLVLPSRAAGRRVLSPSRVRRLLRDRGPAAAEALAPVIPGGWSPPQEALLGEVIALAGECGAAEAFESLHDRWVTRQGPSGLGVTPGPVAELMVDLVGSGRSVLDFACGMGTLPRAFAWRAAGAGDPVRCYGQDSDPALARLALVRLLLDADHTGAEPEVRAGDALLADAFPGLAVDAVLANPPFGVRDWGYERLAYDARWVFGLPPRTEPELAWVQHALAHLVPGGRAVLVMPPAAAVRPAGRRIRSELVRRGALLAVVALPAGMVSSTGVGLNLWVLHNPVPGESVGTHALFIDAASAAGEADAADPVAVRAAVAAAWKAFVADPVAAGVAPGAHAAVPLIDVLDDRVDLSPARHVPLPTAAPLEPAALLTARTEFGRAVDGVVAMLPDLVVADGSPLGAASLTDLGDLTGSGALALLRAAPHQPARDGVGADGDAGPVVSGRDVVAGTGPTGTGPRVSDVEPVRVRAGDVLVPLVGREVVARVATAEQVGAPLGPMVYAVRVDPDVLDPWFLAGVLSGPDNARRAGRVSSTTSGAVRVDVRRLRIPVLPIEVQRGYGEAFRWIAEFDTTLSRVVEQGRDLARSLIRGLADGVLRPDTDPDAHGGGAD
ncbi:MAG TPA: N-6 DNA methylase, partial [Mycobacterium sp.]|nr:N-6 DNA methylase [Mycobacterium sp.]